MAISLNSEDGAPENFRTSFSNDDYGSHLSSNTVSCPLCSYQKRHFHCKKCIRSGEFMHSSHHSMER